MYVAILLFHVCHKIYKDFFTGVESAIIVFYRSAGDPSLEEVFEEVNNDDSLNWLSSDEDSSEAFQSLISYFTLNPGYSK